VVTAAIDDALAAALGGSVRITEHTALTTGTSRLTSSFVAVAGDGSRRRLVLQREQVPSAAGMAAEVALLRRAGAAGLPVPAVLAASANPGALGSAFIVLEHVTGETRPDRVLDDPGLDEARRGLARRCGEVLAGIHRLPVTDVALPDGTDPLRHLREHHYTPAGIAVPTFELAFRRLAGTQPVARGRGLVHGDFRTGNLVVAPDGLAAVLDWELAHVGDPVEDLGWLCARVWRFGRAAAVGGFGDVAELLAGYEAAGGAPVDRAALRWWTTFAALRWGVFCLEMLASHLDGSVRSVERVAIGRRVAEQEWELLRELR